MSNQSPAAGTQAFNTAYPFNVALQNQFQGNDLAVIYITDAVDVDKPEQQINVSITKNGQQHYTLKGQGATLPDAAHYNLAIAIRPGTFRKEVADKFSDILKTALSAALPSNTCTVSSHETRQSDGALLWYCAFENDLDIAPSWSLSIMLKGVTADAGVGSRSSRIEFMFGNLMLSGGANPLSFSRTAHVDIINHQGHTYAPLFFGVSGPNTLLNKTGQKNKFNIYFETIGRVPIAFGPETEIVFSFPYAENKSELLSFGNKTEVDAYSLVTSEIVKFATEKKVDEGTGRVQFTAKFASPSLTTYVFNFSNIQISGTDGVVMLGVGIRNLPGYWDTDFQVPVIKATSTLNDEVLVLGSVIDEQNRLKGSRIDFSSSLLQPTDQAILPPVYPVYPVYIEESKGLNLYGDAKHPVNIQKTDLYIRDGSLTVSGATTLNAELKLGGASLGHIGDGSRIDFLSSGQTSDKANVSKVSIEENWGLNLYGASDRPVKVQNADLQVLNGRIQDKTGPLMPVGSIIAYAGALYKVGRFDQESYRKSYEDLDRQSKNFNGFEHWIALGIKEGRVGFIINTAGERYLGLAFGSVHTAEACFICSPDIPNGWLACDGNPIPNTDAFAELRKVVGENTPNLCGRTLIGTGSLGNGKDTQRFNLYDAGGERQHSLTEAEMPSHSHGSPIGGRFLFGNVDPKRVEVQASGLDKGGYWKDPGLASSPETGEKGSSEGHNNMQPYFTVNYIIKC